jgi:hypothetical protein
VKRPKKIPPPAPLEEALTVTEALVIPADVGPSPEAYLLGRLIRYHLTYLTGLYIIPEELTGVRFAAVKPSFLFGQNLGFEVKIPNFCPVRGLGSQEINRGLV